MRLFWTLVRLHARNAAPVVMLLLALAVAGWGLVAFAHWLHDGWRCDWDNSIGGTVLLGVAVSVIALVLWLCDGPWFVREYFRRTYSEAVEQVRADDSEQASLLRGSGNR